MSPPTEQLIRDYLNRLSVAARGRLSLEERRTLIERTRQLIEQKADFAGRPTTLEVGRVLARLGDPAALVEQEARRLGAVTGEPEYHSVEGGFLARVLRREPAWVRGAHWSAPAELSSEGDAGLVAFDSPAGGEAGIADQAEAWLDPDESNSGVVGEVVDGAVLDGVALDGGALEGTVLDGGALEGTVLDGGALDGGALEGTVLDGEALDGGTLARRRHHRRDGAVLNGGAPDRDGDELVRPQWPDVVARDAGPGKGRKWRGRSPRTPTGPDTARWVTLNGEPVASSAAVNGGILGPGDPPRTGTGSGNWTGAETGGSRTGGIDSAWQDEEPVTSAAGSAVRRLLAGLHDWSRERPVETVALALLGFGGVIFPPVFVLGAAVALLSRLWDYRDKWLGLALPLVLTVIGLAFGIAVGGRAHGIHEGWVWLNISSRLAAAFGACYLARRATRGRRAPAVPPWNKPHKVP